MSRRRRSRGLGAHDHLESALATPWNSHLTGAAGAPYGRSLSRHQPGPRVAVLSPACSIGAEMILSFTTIPPRYQYLGRIVSRIAAQTERPDRVELYLPRNYRRFPGERPSLPPLPDWIDVIQTSKDFGPATKILPAAERWRGRDVGILYFDDDQKYDSNWLARFKALRRERPNEVLCERGFHLHEISDVERTEAPQPRALRRPADGKDWRYRLKRAASLSMVKPLRHGFSASGYIDLAEGNGGVSIKADWLDRRASDIPDILWTVDDAWLSGMFELAGVNIWLNHRGYVQKAFPEADQLEPLYKFVEKGVGRAEANRRCIDYLRDAYGVWR
jgi:hypothetical protein